MHKAVCLCLTLSLLQGCAVAVVAGTATAVTSATDRRTIGTQIDDTSIETKAVFEIKGNEQLAKHTNISVVSLNGVVLLTGQAPTHEMKNQAYQAVKDIAGIKKIHNQIRISNNVGFSTTTHDTWLTSKIKTLLLAEESLSTNHIKVVTENGEVFLMGLVSQQEGNKSAEICRNVNGVTKVIKIFEYL